MQQFIIPSEPPRTVKSRDGSRTFTVQRCGLVGSDGLAQRFDIWHSAGESPYPPGRYVLDVDRSLYVDRRGNLGIRPVLVPVESKKA